MLQKTNKQKICHLSSVLCELSYSESGGRRIMSSRPTPAKLTRPYLKNKIKTKGLGK
jgi:hypothetical protein